MQITLTVEDTLYSFIMCRISRDNRGTILTCLACTHTERVQDFDGDLGNLSMRQPRPARALLLIAQSAIVPSMDEPTSQRIADFRREIEGIQELNKIYRAQKHHGHQDQVANERRKIRLEEVMQQLAALHRRRDSP